MNQKHHKNQRCRTPPLIATNVCVNHNLPTSQSAQEPAIPIILSLINEKKHRPQLKKKKRSVDIATLMLDHERHHCFETICLDARIFGFELFGVCGGILNFIDSAHQYQYECKIVDDQPRELEE